MVGARAREDGCFVVRRPPADQCPRPLCRRGCRPSVSTKSAMRWAKAESPRPPSATTLPRSPLLRRRGTRSRTTAVRQVGDSALNGISELAALALDLEQVAGAVILDRDDLPTGCRRDPRRESDQVGVIIFAVLERRQRARSISTSEPRSASAATRSPTPRTARPPSCRRRGWLSRRARCRRRTALVAGQAFTLSVNSLSRTSPWIPWATATAASGSSATRRHRFAP